MTQPMPPPCRCTHLAEVHDRHSKTRTSPCSAADPHKCPCTRYQPREETP